MPVLSKNGVKLRIISTTHAAQAAEANQASRMSVTPIIEGCHIGIRRLAGWR